MRMVIHSWGNRRVPGPEDHREIWDCVLDRRTQDRFLCLMWVFGGGVIYFGSWFQRFLVHQGEDTMTATLWQPKTIQRMPWLVDWPSPFPLFIPFKPPACRMALPTLGEDLSPLVKFHRTCMPSQTSPGLVWTNLCISQLIKLIIMIYHYKLTPG